MNVLPPLHSETLYHPALSPKQAGGFVAVAVVGVDNQAVDLSGFEQLKRGRVRRGVMLRDNFYHMAGQKALKGRSKSR